MTKNKEQRVVAHSTRLLGEEKLPKEELDGYREYQSRVRRRLIPFVF